MRGSSLTLEVSRMIFGVSMSAVSPVGKERANGASGCSGAHRSSVAISRRCVFSQVQKKKEKVVARSEAGFEVAFGIGAVELKVLHPVAREVLFALVDACRQLMSCTPHFPNQPLEPTTTAVTPRADARVAPSAVVAHL
jgi:hypothetical protein